MSYKEALEAAGAKVHRFIETGSYQGSWYAFVWYDGHLGWVQGSYGSCSGCDAFEAEFSDSYLDLKGDDEKASYQKRLAEFGKSYLGTVESHEDLMRQLVNQRYIGSDDEEAIDKLNVVAREFGFRVIERKKEE